MSAGSRLLRCTSKKPRTLCCSSRSPASSPRRLLAADHSAPWLFPLLDWEADACGLRLRPKKRGPPMRAGDLPRHHREGRVASAAPFDAVGMDQDHVGRSAPFAHKPRARLQRDRRRGFGFTIARINRSRESRIGGAISMKPPPADCAVRRSSMRRAAPPPLRYRSLICPYRHFGDGGVSDRVSLRYGNVGRHR